MKILTIGDVVGRRSIEYLSKNLRKTAASLGADLVVCNGENASEIHGLSLRDAEALLDCGVDLITLGNHAFGSRDIYGYLDDNTDRIIRPANYPDAVPGHGWCIADAAGRRVLVLNLAGCVYMESLVSPFDTADKILKMNEGKYDAVIVDIHAEATSEKMALARYLDGRASAVFGTHTHVATADAQVLPGGTGYITDLGMCGSHAGILGVATEDILHKFRMKTPVYFTPAKGQCAIHGVLFEIDGNGKCVKAEGVRWPE